MQPPATSDTPREAVPDNRTPTETVTPQSLHRPSQAWVPPQEYSRLIQLQQTPRQDTVLGTWSPFVGFEATETVPQYPYQELMPRPPGNVYHEYYAPPDDMQLSYFQQQQAEYNANIYAWRSTYSNVFQTAYSSPQVFDPRLYEGASNLADKGQYSFPSTHFSHDPALIPLERRPNEQGKYGAEQPDPMLLASYTSTPKRDRLHEPQESDPESESDADSSKESARNTDSEEAGKDAPRRAMPASSRQSSRRARKDMRGSKARYTAEENLFILKAREDSYRIPWWIIPLAAADSYSAGNGRNGRNMQVHYSQNVHPHLSDISQLDEDKQQSLEKMIKDKLEIFYKGVTDEFQRVEKYKGEKPELAIMVRRYMQERMRESREVLERTLEKAHRLKHSKGTAIKVVKTPAKSKSRRKPRRR